MHFSRMRTVRCSGRLGGGVCLEGCLPGGVSAQGGVAPNPDPEADTPPVDRMTDACENITFPQLLLRTVNMKLLRDRNKVNSSYAL